MRRNHRDAYPFHRQGDSQGYRPPPAIEPQPPFWWLIILSLAAWGVVIAAGVGVLIPICRWVLGAQ